MLRCLIKLAFTATILFFYREPRSNRGLKNSLVDVVLGDQHMLKS